MKTKAYYYVANSEGTVYFDKVTKFTKYLRNTVGCSTVGVEFMNEEEFKTVDLNVRAPTLSLLAK